MIYLIQLKFVKIFKFLFVFSILHLGSCFSEADLANSLYLVSMRKDARVTNKQPPKKIGKFHISFGVFLYVLFSNTFELFFGGFNLCYCLNVLAY